jgi:hypothetical protein
MVSVSRTETRGKGLYSCILFAGLWRVSVGPGSPEGNPYDLLPKLPLVCLEGLVLCQPVPVPILQPAGT